MISPFFYLSVFYFLLPLFLSLCLFFFWLSRPLYLVAVSRLVFSLFVYFYFREHDGRLSSELFG